MVRQKRSIIDVSKKLKYAFEINVPITTNPSPKHAKMYIQKCTKMPKTTNENVILPIFHIVSARLLQEKLHLNMSA